MTDAIDFAVHRMPRPQEVARMSTEELRLAFLVGGLFSPGKLRLQFTDLDRMVVGGAMPTSAPLPLENCRETGRAFFLERRELGAINIGGAGVATVDGQAHPIEPEGCLYIGVGAREILFHSADPGDPAKFVVLSCPAHAVHPTTTATPKEANAVSLGTPEQANQRVIRQYIHEKGIPSCQLVMGYTELADGSVWNTFPPHTHTRRSEVYFYWNLGERVLAHFMGEPQATRHLFLHNEEAVLSPKVRRCSRGIV
jgi:4-deoxy-L-threo-5-hexosulose-uronate ketol-isomerase